MIKFANDLKVARSLANVLKDKIFELTKEENTTRASPPLNRNLQFELDNTTQDQQKEDNSKKKRKRTHN